MTDIRTVDIMQLHFHEMNIPYLIISVRSPISEVYAVMFKVTYHTLQNFEEGEMIKINLKRET